MIPKYISLYPRVSVDFTPHKITDRDYYRNPHLFKIKEQGPVGAQPQLIDLQHSTCSLCWSRTEEGEEREEKTVRVRGPGCLLPDTVFNI